MLPRRMLTARSFLPAARRVLICGAVLGALAFAGGTFWTFIGWRVLRRYASYLMDAGQVGTAHAEHLLQISVTTAEATLWISAAGVFLFLACGLLTLAEPNSDAAGDSA